MKIIKNNCFGGWSISNKALVEYQKTKGNEVFFYIQTKYKHRDGEDEYKKVDASSDNLFSYTLIKDYGDIIKGELPYEDGEYVSTHCDELRTDPILIEIIERLGDEANGRCASLKVVEIPDDIEYEIDEYDGIETIREKHRTW